MTTETRNEAAERLARYLAKIGEDDAHAVLTDALAAERRATVARIRDRLAGTTSRYHEGHFVKAGVNAILDEEAAR